MYEPHFDAVFDKVANKHNIQLGHFYSKKTLKKICLQVACELEEEGTNYAEKTLRNMGFNDFEPPMVHITDMYCKLLISVFIERLSLERFPMLNQRINHLKELMEDTTPWTFTNKRSKAFAFAGDLARDIDNKTESLDKWLPILISTFPGYANDMFLKRASLFFMMLNRKMGWFAKDIHQLHIPADYQIPKILRHFEVLHYYPHLASDIDEGRLIPAGSLQECEIRASTIIAANLIAKEANVTTTQIDDYLWLNRKMTNKPFHLTYTTDY